MIFSLAANSSIGFHTDMLTLPERVYSLWGENVFQLSKWTTDSDQHLKLLNGSGTAFLVFSNQEFSYFVTAKHVANVCSQSGSVKCKLSSDSEFDTKALIFNKDISEFLTVVDTWIFSPTEKKWKYDLFANDIAIVRTKSIGRFFNAFDFQIFDLAELKNIAGQAYYRTHFVLGYPYLNARHSIRDKYDHSILKMRWSKGEILRIGTTPLMKLKIQSNADSLVGNSGGPVIAEDGTLIGILNGGPNFLEYQDFPVMFSYITPATYVKFLIGSILLKRSDAKRLN